VHDGIELEKRGIPAAVICTEEFENMGRASAAAAGLPDYPFAIVPHPIGRLSDEELQRKAEKAAPQAIELLLAR
jgi:hypothetical protein